MSISMRFKDLPKGARYKYPDSDDIWVVIEAYGYGLVAKWEGISSGVRQSLCRFVDDEYSLESTVDVIDYAPPVNAEHYDTLKLERDNLAARVQRLEQVIFDAYNPHGFDPAMMPKLKAVLNETRAQSMSAIKADALEELRRKYPMQPIALDEHGRPRFEANPIINYLACEVIDLNRLSMWCQENDIEKKYQEQLSQLIGYSVGGYGELSHVSDESYDLAHDEAAALREGKDDE